MKNLSLTLAFVIVVLSGCKKDEEPDPFCGFGTISSCINQKIQAIKSEPVTTPATKIFSYQYRGQTVYYIPAQCCDFPSELYDENCNLICYPDGGFSGNGDGLCNDFYDKATNKTLIWEDPRPN